MKAPKEEHLIEREIIAFLLDRRARNLSPRSIEFYQRYLDAFHAYLRTQHPAPRVIEDITPTHIRAYLASLAETGHTDGGIHAAFRALRAFFRWLDDEFDTDAWRNPLRKIRAPHLPQDPLPGVTKDQIFALLATCNRKHHYYDIRDAAIILTLFDTGLRRAEFLALNYGDLDLTTGDVRVRQGKGRKSRTVFLGARARRQILRYLRFRPQIAPNDPLWVTTTGKRLTAAGLRQIIRRRAERAGIDPPPGLHDFRRAFAIEALRNGMDVVTLARLMGHTDIAITRRYLHLVETDLQRAHAAASPADHL